MKIKRFSNKVQLIRHIAEETNTDIDELWEQYDEQIE